MCFSCCLIVKSAEFCMAMQNFALKVSFAFWGSRLDERLLMPLVKNLYGPHFSQEQDGIGGILFYNPDERSIDEEVVVYGGGGMAW